MHHRTLRRLLALALATLLASAPLAACSSDDDGDATTTTAAETTESESGAGEPGEETAEGDAGEEEGGATEPEELGTTELLEFLLDEEPEIGTLFDWNEGNGVIAITYLGVQTVQLFTDAELDVETATTACELASDYVFPIDEEAAIEVLVGDYPNGTLVVSVQGADDACTAA